MLDQQNPKNVFTQAANLSTPKYAILAPTHDIKLTIRSGLFDTSSGTPLQLLVDIKTDGKT